MRSSMTRRRFRVLVARCVWSVVAATPSIACADEPTAARSLADIARETAARAVERVWHDTQDVAQFALGLLGVEYRWGGETPERGLDCSGLVRYVFQQVTGVTLPRTARELSRVGSSVQLSDLQVGDLVFFNTRRLAFSHVGLYLGDSRFIHAPARGREVEISTLASGYWQKQFNGARRLVGVLPAMIPEVLAAPAPVSALAGAGGEEAAAQP